MLTLAPCRTGIARLDLSSYEGITEVMTGFGQMRVSAESLARTAAHRIVGYMKGPVFAGPDLAEQLLPPMALAGRGCFTTVKPSEHACTAAMVIERFTGRACRFTPRAGCGHEVAVK